MGRPRSAARLYLRHRAGRPPVWVILDGQREVSTGCGEGDDRGAGVALARHLAAKFAAPGALPPGELYIDEVMASYLKEHAAHSPSRAFLVHTAGPILEWWTMKTLADITGGNCRAYVAWRTAQNRKRHPGSQKAPAPISDQTARHELKTLRTAVNWYHREHGPLPSVPRVTLPARAPQRLDYWLSRDEVAARIRAARRRGDTRHVARLLLIGVYSGTRPGAIMRLEWTPSTDGGWLDLENAVLHRRGLGARRSKKRAPPARIHARLLPHLVRWHSADMAAGISHVIHHNGAPVMKLRRSWAGVAGRANAARHDTPHIVRHTAATWQMQAGTDLAEAAGYLGMTPETLWETYGHHHPDFQAAAAQAVAKRAAGVRRSRWAT